MNKCYNCGYCQEQCGKREPTEEEIIEEDPKEPEFIRECGEGIEDIEEWEPEPIEEELEDNSDIIYCYE